MQQEATQKFIVAEGLGFYLGAVCVVFIAKCGVGAADVLDAAITDGDAMCIAAEVFENLFGSCKRRLAIDHPGFGVQVIYKMLQMFGTGRKQATGRIVDFTALIALV